MGISCPRRTAGTWNDGAHSILLSMRGTRWAIAAEFTGNLLRAGRNVHEVDCAVEEGERALCYITDSQ
jgi:hypothetical protein